MITLQNNFFSSFIKASLLTALLMGGLLAQSYATTTLFNGASMSEKAEFKSDGDRLRQPQVVKIQVQNQQVNTQNHIIISKQ